MSDSPILPEARELAGDWRVEGGSGACVVSFGVERVEAANAHRLQDPTACLRTLLGADIAGWRPATDGIDIVRPDRLSAGFFSFQPDGTATLNRPGRPSYVLRRVTG